MDSIVPVHDAEEIPPEYRDTPIGRLLAYHDLEAPFETYDRAALLVGTCMDHRVRLRIPENFTYVVRTGGANLRGRDFEVSFAIAVGGIRAIALIGHSDCGMARVKDLEEEFVEGLVEGGGWGSEEAEEHYRSSAPVHAIEDPIEFTLSEARRLRLRYPETLVAPLHYRVEDHHLYLIRE